MLTAIPQPTYVNMHELASMAASKAQELNLPPPPADFITPTAPTPTEKVRSENPNSLNYYMYDFLNSKATFRLYSI